MPEEQEERMLRITETMVEEFGKWADDNGPMPEWVWYLYGNEFGKLEPVPEPQEHSDEDYYGALAVQDEIRLDLSMAELRIIELEADYANLINHTDPDYVTGLQRRIKKLEAQADNCIVCGTVRRVEELRAKERANKHTDDKPEG